MKSGPDIALIGSLVGDPARANMLTALMGGRALTPSELAQEAGITLQTTSSHLAKLTAGGLVVQRKQGRHRYFSLSGQDVAGVLEHIMGLAARVGHLRVRTGPRDPALRHARVCYDHLAGDLGVRLLDGLTGRAIITGATGATGATSAAEDLHLTSGGEIFVRDLGIDLAALQKLRRPLCKACLDWSARRSHLAGALGAAFLQRFYDLKWATRDPETRAVIFTQPGEKAFQTAFEVGD